MQRRSKSPASPGGGFIDIHHHILPGVDDGPRTFQEAEAMLALAYRDGTRHIIATSHFDPMGICPDVARLQGLLDQLNHACMEKFPGLSLSLGAEILFGEGLRRRLRQGLIPTMAGGEHVLVEFLPSVTREALEQAVRHLANGGYVTIMAHMERYPALVKDMDFARYLKDKYGALLQVNTEAFLDRQPFSVRRFLKRAVPGGLVDFVASDSHGANRRRTRLQEVYGLLTRRFGEVLARSLLSDKARTIFPHLMQPRNLHAIGEGVDLS